MRMSRLHQLLPLLLVAACTNSTTVVDVDVASVVVSPSSASLEVGVTLQFTAQAFDASSNAINGQPVVWESSVEGVATVSTAGVALGVAPGNTDIRATIGGVTGTQTLTVSPTACTSRTDVVLSPGQYLSFPGDACLLLPAGAAGDIYRVAVARPTLIANASNTADVTLSVSPVQMPAASGVETEPAPAQAPRIADGLPRLDASRALEHLRWQEATRRFHIELRLRERAIGFDPSLLLTSPAAAQGAPPAGVDPPVSKMMYLDLSCSAVTPKAVQRIAFSDNLVIYQDSIGWASDPISTAAADEMLSYYSDYVKGMIDQYWGRPSDLDANERLIVVTTPSLDDGVAAAVFSGDFYQPGPQCATSNEGEVIYFQADLIRALDDADPGYFALGVVAHEAKHVVSLYHGIQRGSPGPAEFNDLWVEEGTAEISAEMSSRIAWAATGGPPVNARITRTDILQAVQANGGSETREMSALVDAIAGIVRSLSSHPNSVITDPTGADEGHSFYSTSWHWHRFLGDAFGNAASAPRADSSFFRQLTSRFTPAGGASGEIQITGRSFEQLFEDLVVAVSFQGTPNTPTYALSTYDFATVGDIFNNPNPTGSYPWPVTADDHEPTGPPTSWVPFGSHTYSGPIGPSGIRFHDFRSSGSAAAQIQVTGSNQPCDGGPSGARCDVIIVTRLN